MVYAFFIVFVLLYVIETMCDVLNLNFNRKRPEKLKNTLFGTLNISHTAPKKHNQMFKCLD